jgi:hypothetical protein
MIGFREIMQQKYLLFLNNNKELNEYRVFSSDEINASPPISGITFCL